MAEDSSILKTRLTPSTLRLVTTVHHQCHHTKVTLLNFQTLKTLRMARFLQNTLIAMLQLVSSHLHSHPTLIFVGILNIRPKSPCIRLCHPFCSFCGLYNKIMKFSVKWVWRIFRAYTVYTMKRSIVCTVHFIKMMQQKVTQKSVQQITVNCYSLQLIFRRLIPLTVNVMLINIPNAHNIVQTGAKVYGTTDMWI